MVAVPLRSQPRLTPSRFLPVSIAALLAALLGLSVPVSADHIQADATKSILFDHRAGNEWWVEVMLGGRDPASVGKVEAMDDGGPWVQLTKRSWGAWAASFHIEPGHKVVFRASWPDGETRTSCWFEHPSGVERCDTPPPTGFDASFSSVRGNEWWVQGNVLANGPVAKVDVTLDNGATWRPLAKQSWGGWAASYHIVQGTIVRLRATSTDGQTDLSSCRQWIPPSGQDAQVVACPGSGAFDATFTGVKGNEWWVQVDVAANQPVAGVAVRVDCAPQWRPLALQSWGGWTASFHIPAGSKVDFQARAGTGAVDASSGYTWTAATPTSGCVLGAWPQDGSTAVYSMSGGVCGGGECFNSRGTLTLTYRSHAWTGICSGEDEHYATTGEVTVTPWSGRLDIPPLFERAATQPGAQHQVREVSTFYQSGCGVDEGRLQTVVQQEAKATALKDASGNYVTIQAWRAERNVDGENYYVTFWDTDLGMVLEQASHPRRSQQGSWYTALVDTDAPLQ